jgi:hypothetical protein
MKTYTIQYFTRTDKHTVRIAHVKALTAQIAIDFFYQAVDGEIISIN